MVADLVREIMSQSQTKTPTQGDFDNFEINENPLAASFMTAYQSVDYLCPRVVSDMDTSFEAQEASFVYNEGNSTVLVDESIISHAVCLHCHCSSTLVMVPFFIFVVLNHNSRQILGDRS